MVINSIVEALRRRDLGPALSWAEQRTDQLHQMVSGFSGLCLGRL